MPEAPIAIVAVKVNSALAPLQCNRKVQMAVAVNVRCRKTVGDQIRNRGINGGAVKPAAPVVLVQYHIGTPEPGTGNDIQVAVPVIIAKGQQVGRSSRNNG